MNTLEAGGRERKEEKAMSLRKIVKILGISPTYLSLLLNGKRPWRGNLKERYEELVNTFGNTNGHVRYEKLVPREGFEPTLSLREADFKSAASTIPPPRQLCGNL